MKKISLSDAKVGQILNHPTYGVIQVIEIQTLGMAWTHNPLFWGLKVKPLLSKDSKLVHTLSEGHCTIVTDKDYINGLDKLFAEEKSYNGERK